MTCCCGVLLLLLLPPPAARCCTCSVADLSALSNLQTVKLNLVVSAMHGLTTLQGLSELLLGVQQKAGCAAQHC